MPGRSCLLGAGRLCRCLCYLCCVCCCLCCLCCLCCCWGGHATESRRIPSSKRTTEGFTLFVSLAEHRGSAHGPPPHSTAITTAFHGQPRTLLGLPRTLHGLPWTFHGLPRNTAASSGTPWRPMALAMVISTAISTAWSTTISTAISTATHGKHPRHTTAGHGTTERPTAIPTAWGWPWNMPWQLPWYFRGLPWLVPRRLPGTEPRHVPWPQPWHLPWKRHEQ